MTVDKGGGVLYNYKLFFFWFAALFFEKWTTVWLGNIKTMLYGPDIYMPLLYSFIHFPVKLVAFESLRNYHNNNNVFFT